MWLSSDAPRWRRSKISQTSSARIHRPTASLSLKATNRQTANTSPHSCLRCWLVHLNCSETNSLTLSLLPLPGRSTETVSSVIYKTSCRPNGSSQNHVEPAKTDWFETPVWIQKETPSAIESELRIATQCRKEKEVWILEEIKNQRP